MTCRYVENEEILLDGIRVVFHHVDPLLLAGLVLIYLVYVEQYSSRPFQNYSLRLIKNSSSVFLNYRTLIDVESTRLSKSFSGQMSMETQ